MGSEPTVVEKQDGVLFFQPFPENKLQYYFASEEIARLGNVRCTVYYYSGTLPLKGQYHEIFDPLIFFNKGTVARDFRPSVFFNQSTPPMVLIHGLKPFRIWLQNRFQPG
jgi:hypothetical protein